jgi:hypothetical protein
MNSQRCGCRATQGPHPFISRGRNGGGVGSAQLGGVGPPPYLGGPMEQVILVLGQLALILAGVVCVVGFVLLIVSMVLTTLRKLLEFTRL